MAEMTVDLFVSVDGWAGGDGLPAFFGYGGPELAEWVRAEQAVQEVVLMGRRTYEVFSAMPEEAWGDDRAHLMRLDKMVFSRTLDSVDWPRTRVSADLPGTVAELRRESPVRLRTWGSLSIARQLLAAGQVDRLRLMRFPLIAGEAGREAAFAGAADADLERVAHRVLDGRLILETYRPTGLPIPRS